MNYDPLFFLSFAMIPFVAIMADSPTEPSIGFTSIPDTSELPLLNPDLSGRQTAKLRLDNGMEILLISDPEADHALP